MTTLEEEIQELDNENERLRNDLFAAEAAVIEGQRNENAAYTQLAIAEEELDSLRAKIKAKVDEWWERATGWGSDSARDGIESCINDIKAILEEK